MSKKNSNQFDQRFQSVVAKMRFTRVFSVIGWMALLLSTSLIVLACLDYFFEINWGSRATAVGIATVGVATSATWLVVKALQQWNRRATAAQVEKRFSDLGQSVRTSVQFRDEAATQSGVSPSLLDALNDDVATRTDDLRLTEAVSTGPLKGAVVLLGLLGLVTLGACWTSWDWRMAASRVLLGNTPYTTVHVAQGDVRVEEKATFTLNTDISGRTNRNVTLLTRELESEGDTWEKRALTKKDTTAEATRLVSYVVEIPKVKKPFEYQVVAGKYASPVHRVDVQYPLAITAFRTELTSPEYTGLGTKNIDKGSFDAVEGSVVRMGIELDHEPAKAWLELRPISTPLGEDPMIEKVDLEINGRQLSTTLDLQQDRFYQVKAEAADGTKLRPNRYRIRVHEDRAPKLGFRSPDQLIEVHPLAELVMKLKVADDYGLRRAGIVFQRNNEDEIVLEDIAYEDIVMDDGRLSPQTKTLIESSFPLEYFELTIKDSISYYGFAEDNRPGTANVNETDLQFIDVRPYRREFPVPSDNQGLAGMSNNPNSRNLPELNEMIGRERFVLNRTMQMKRHDDRGRKIEANTIDGLINVQNETSSLSGLMGDAATAIEIQFGIPEEGRISDLLYQAQKSMLDSVDSLSNNEYELAKLQEKDALQYLIDARQRLDAPPNGQGGRGGAAFRNAFRRLMRQRRQPRNNRERAREVVRRLRRAAAEQEFLMDKMSDLIPPEVPETNTPEDEADEQGPEEQDIEQEADMREEQAEQDAELRRELEEEQSELSEDILDIVDLMEELNQLTNLAEQRSTRASSNMSQIIRALEGGNTQGAMALAQSASSALRILAENIEGVTAEESTKRLEVARDLGMLLTDEIHNLEDQIKSAEDTLAEADLDKSGMLNKEQQLAAPLSRQARDQAEIARTIEDILNSILDPELGIQDEEDRMVKRLREILDENKFADSVTRMEALPAVIDGNDWSNAAVQSDDLADRFDVVSQRLDAMHREILSPRIEQLRKLEKRAVTAKQQMTEVQTHEQVDRWESRTRGLLDDLESAKVAEAQAAQLQEAMDERQPSASWQEAGNGTLQAPGEFGEGLGFVISEIQRHIRELSNIESEVTNSGAVPVRYRQFVERYLEVLTGAIDGEADADSE